MIDFKNKKVLITGGTGSFGSTMLKHLIQQDVKEVVVFSRDEKKQEDLRIELSEPRVNFVIGDIRDFKSINTAMHGVDYVFQAAALKQVPSCEFYPMQAVKTNILGSENVLESAIQNRVKRLVVLSTDKAVYPINTMGMTKALMEKLAISKARDPRLQKYQGIFTATRYGNVMASRGSIIPLFVKQAKNNEPLTITNPKMTRFMMSLPQSVNLVLHAFQNGMPGDIFVQKAPAATILTLAETIKQIFNSSSEIKIIGPRHGEKLYEVLCGTEEMIKAEDQGDFYRIPADLRDMNYSKFREGSIEIKSDISDYNSHNTKRLNQQELRELLLGLQFIKDEL